MRDDPPVTPHLHGPNTTTGRTPRWLLVLLAVLTLATVAGMVALWPTGPRSSTAQGSTFVHGTVRSSTEVTCGTGRCRDDVVELTDGPERGGTTSLQFPLGVGTSPDLQVGDDIRLQRGDPGQSGGRIVYAFDDIQRGTALFWFAAVFAVLVVLVARWRGVAAIAGLGVTFLVILAFLLPALLEGRSPLLVGVVAAAAMALAVVPLAHGLNAKSAVALAGTLLGVAACAGLAALAVAVSRLTGLSADEVSTLQALGSPTTVGGLVLCGAVVGSVGVLNDVTVTQASAVVELAALDPTASRAALLAAGMRVGRDHIASTVYTLALAYAGSALPVLLLLTTSGRGGLDSLTSDAVAGEIVRGLAGGIGLVLAVPITTALAAVAAVPRPRRPDVRSMAAEVTGHRPARHTRR